MQEAKQRMVFDWETNEMNMSKRRATDIKGNARVIFPQRSKDFEVESRLELYRIEAMQVYRQYMKKNCDKKGTQQSNLTPAQQRGLKSLKQG